MNSSGEDEKQKTNSHKSTAGGRSLPVPVDSSKLRSLKSSKRTTRRGRIEAGLILRGNLAAGRAEVAAQVPVPIQVTWCHPGPGSCWTGHVFPQLRPLTAADISQIQTSMFRVGAEQLPQAGCEWRPSHGPDSAHLCKLTVPVHTSSWSYRNDGAGGALGRGGGNTCSAFSSAAFLPVSPTNTTLVSTLGSMSAREQRGAEQQARPRARARTQTHD